MGLALTPMLLAAGLLAAPLPNASKQVGPPDYPSNFLAANKSAAAILEIIINPDGKIAQCRVIKPFGDEKFANKLCDLQRPLSWHRAFDENGQPTFGVVTPLFRMFVPGTEQGDGIASLVQSPDLVLMVNRLPKNAPNPSDVKISVKVDGRGSMIGCEARPNQAVPGTLTALACDQARELKFGLVHLDGKPLPSFVVEQKIRFALDTAPVAPAEAR